MADEGVKADLGRPKKREHVATNLDVRKYLGVAVATITFLTGSGLFAGAQWVISDARAQSKAVVDAGQAEDLKARAELERKLDEHIRDEAQARRIQAEATHNAQLDIRELYNSWRFDKRSTRLETPLPPLPTPDAGR